MDERARRYDYADTLEWKNPLSEVYRHNPLSEKNPFSGELLAASEWGNPIIRECGSMNCNGWMDCYGWMNDLPWMDGRIAVDGLVDCRGWMYRRGWMYCVDGCIVVIRR